MLQIRCSTIGQERCTCPKRARKENLQSKTLAPFTPTEDMEMNQMMEVHSYTVQAARGKKNQMRSLLLNVKKF